MLLQQQQEQEQEQEQDQEQPSLINHQMENAKYYVGFRNFAYEIEITEDWELILIIETLVVFLFAFWDLVYHMGALFRKTLSTPLPCKTHGVSVASPDGLCNTTCEGPASPQTKANKTKEGR